MLLPVEAPGISHHDDSQTIQHAEQHRVTQPAPSLAELRQHQQQSQTEETEEHRVVTGESQALVSTETETLSDRRANSLSLSPHQLSQSPL